MQLMERGVLQEAADWWRGLGNAQRFFAFALLLAPLFLLLWREGRYLTLLLFGLPGLWFGVRVGFLRFMDSEARLLLWLLWLFLAIGLIAWAVGGFTEDGAQRFDRHNRLLLFVPWLISLLWLQPPARLLWALMAVSAVVVAGAGLLEIWAAGEGLSHRVQGDAHPMSFALGCTLLAAVLAGGAWQYRASRLLAAFLLLAAMAATLAMLMTGVRAGVLGLGLAFLVLAIGFGVFRDRLGLLLFLGAPLLLGVLVVTFAADGMKARMTQGVEQIRDYRAVEAAMPPRKASRAGCQDDPRLLAAMLMPDIVLLQNMEVHLLEGEAGADCGSGTRYRMVARDGQAATARLPRQSLLSSDDRAAVVHARGQGARIALNGHDWVTVPDTLSRLDLSHSEARRSAISIRLAPGGWLEFTPEARWPGEYRYPHVVQSMSLRLEMWRVALGAFLERPLLGHGIGSFNLIAREWVEQGRAAPVLGHFDHAHSEYMDTLATRGLLGLSSLLLLLAGLARACFRPGRQQRGQPAAHRAGLPFTAAWVALAAIFLTEASLSMNLNTVTIALFAAFGLYLAGHGTQPEDWQRNRLRLRRKAE